MKTMKTYTTKPSHVESQWHVFDAKDKVLGRLATEVSGLLQGKHKSTYARNILTGDFVVVVNVAQVKITGDKLEQKLYRRHSHYPGGLRETTMARMRQNHPDRILREAVRGMLPKTILGRQMLGRLKIYATDTHPHGAQVKDMASPELLVVPAPVEVERPLHVDVEVNEQPVEVVAEESVQDEVEVSEQPVDAAPAEVIEEEPVQAEIEEPVDVVAEEPAEAEVEEVEQPVDGVEEEPAQAEIEESTEESTEDEKVES